MDLQNFVHLLQKNKGGNRMKRPNRYPYTKS
uniref:Uncharacterized protein n=2 Tax=unclassified Caudoviricetes TaxID=2788787 RepID=A0A8S5QM52_9CAUD|nr:MAG TPA: hypothetical protein [Siphoviridae sp. ctV7t52]DAF86132.1 MAG TPA: hypothetical protein [Siphoviridae sp. ctnX725]